MIPPRGRTEARIDYEATISIKASARDTAKTPREFAVGQVSIMFPRLVKIEENFFELQSYGLVDKDTKITSMW